ncbi:hypothetical protein MIR68_008889 [Amoeboaphelidium protococcarum]|nr:hypothetical protein MIR68_008889 [Amoeboaphelidium protococcarum]
MLVEPSAANPAPPITNLETQNDDQNICFRSAFLCIADNFELAPPSTGIPRGAFKKPEYLFTRLTEFAGKKVKEYANALNNRDYADFKKWLYVDVETGDRVGALEKNMLITGDWIETIKYVDYYSEGELDESVFQPPVDIECQNAGTLLESMSQNFQQFVMQL